MKSPRPRTLHLRVALAALSLLLLAPNAYAQEQKPAQTPPAEGGGGPGPVSEKDRNSDGPFRQNQVETKAVITFKPKPGFTDASLENDASGVVRLRAVLSSTGEVKGVSVIKGLPDGLTEKAIEAAMHVRFTPARRYGHTVSQYVTLEYDFNVYDEDADKKVEILEQPQPSYTEAALKNRVAGKVVINAHFGRDGTVDITRIIEGLPDGLSERAVEAARRIKFKPAELKGRKVTVVRKVVYVFAPDADAKP